MNMNRLEKFIKHNREQLDDMPVPENAWQQIEASLPLKNGKRIAMINLAKWSVAATLLVGVSIIALLVMHKKNTPENVIAKGNDTIVTDLNALTPEEAPEMNQFAKLINLKQEELKTLAKEQPILYQKFSKDITQLDSSYNSLKNKLSSSPNREMLIEAMIQNLQLQLNVLNQQLNIIQQIKQSKNNHHEKNKSII
jgi:hypothetical protein